MSERCHQGDGCPDDGTGCGGPCSVERLCPPSPPSLDAGVVVQAPVCGSDGHTYAGQCAVRVAACMSDVSLRVVHDGPCDEQLSGSGGNDEPSAGRLSLLSFSLSFFLSFRCDI